MVYLGWKKPLVQSDLWTIGAYDRTQTYSEKLQTYWEEELARWRRYVAVSMCEKNLLENCALHILFVFRSQPNISTPEGTMESRKVYEPSLTKALVKTAWAPFLQTAVLRMVADVSVFVSPQVMKYEQLSLDVQMLEKKLFFFNISQYSSVLFSIRRFSSVFFSICLFRFFPLLDSSLVSCRIRASKIGRDISTLSWCLAGPSRRSWRWAISSSWANVVGCTWSQPWSHAFIKRYETRMSSRSSDIIRSKCRKIDENHVLLEWDFFPLKVSGFKEFFTKIPVPPTIRFHPNKKIKGGSTQNRWLLMGDFSKGGVHKTDGSWWVIFQRGEYTKPMGLDGFWNFFYCFWKLNAWGVYFGKNGMYRALYVGHVAGVEVVKRGEAVQHGGRNCQPDGGGFAAVRRFDPSRANYLVRPIPNQFGPVLPVGRAGPISAGRSGRHDLHGAHQFRHHSLPATTPSVQHEE